jgi:hypothetical protein
MRSKRSVVWSLMTVCPFFLMGCVGPGPRPWRSPPPPPLPSAIPYVDSEAFDGVLAAALVRQDPVIVVQTASATPNWQGRLNGWIAAWNKGGRVESKHAVAGTRSLVELPPDSAAVTQEMVDRELDRIEKLARESVAWWIDEQKRRERVAMLQPYLLQMDSDEKGNLRVIFYR